MKKWILNLKFVKEAIRQAGIEAFKKAEKDVLEILPDNYFNNKVDEAVKEKLQELLSPINWDNVVSYNPQTKQIFIGKNVVDPARLANLKAERAFILESDIWKLLTETPKAEAQNSMFIKGESLDDMKKGKIMLFTLDQQGKILDVFR